MTPEAFARAMEATWPPERGWRVGPFRLRHGAGGGKRVSAATLEGAWGEADVRAAQAAMAVPLFRIGPGEEALDALLAEWGYHLVDPVVAYARGMADMEPAPWFAAFPHWPPLQMACDLWAEAGIGPARLAVMARVAGPKAVILGRSQDRPAGVAFAALTGGCVMVHALEVAPDVRRRVVAGGLLRGAADWGRALGASEMALVVTRANGPARALYEKLGMQVVGGYHYRQKVAE